MAGPSVTVFCRSCRRSCAARPTPARRERVRRPCREGAAIMASGANLLVKCSAIGDGKQPDRAVDRLRPAFARISFGHRAPAHTRSHCRLCLCRVSGAFVDLLGWVGQSLQKRLEEDWTIKVEPATAITTALRAYSDFSQDKVPERKLRGTTERIRSATGASKYQPYRHR